MGKHMSWETSNRKTHRARQIAKERAPGPRKYSPIDSLPMFISPPKSAESILRGVLRRKSRKPVTLVTIGNPAMQHD